jgi:ketosteroid isomerase-like protein
VHGAESDEVEAEGKRFSVNYVYLDVLRKENGQWKLVASQLARPVEI